MKTSQRCARCSSYVREGKRLPVVEKSSITDQKLPKLC